MVPLPESLTLVLAAPSADTVWRLRGDLLASESPPDPRLLSLLAAFHDYLDRLATGLSSREFSNLASKLDIAAVSGVILDRLAEASDPPTLALDLLSGAVSEGLMVLATRQHVRAWEGELATVHRSAAWILYDELWRWTGERSPAISPDDRRSLLDELMAPILAPDSPGLLKAALICRLFQLLIAAEATGAPVGPASVDPMCRKPPACRAAWWIAHLRQRQPSGSPFIQHTARSATVTTMPDTKKPVVFSAGGKTYALPASAAKHARRVAQHCLAEGNPHPNPYSRRKPVAAPVRAPWRHRVLRSFARWPPPARLPRGANCQRQHESSCADGTSLANAGPASAPAQRLRSSGCVASTFHDAESRPIFP